MLRRMSIACWLGVWSFLEVGLAGGLSAQSAGVIQTADLAGLGIRVNAVCPGEINTAILSPGTDELVSRIPMKRLGSPAEVAAAIYYLCSPQASYVTGAEIPVNGGQDVY